MRATDAGRAAAKAFGIALALCAAFACLPAHADATPIQVSATPLAGGGTQYSIPVQTLLFFTALSFLPAVLLMMTSFTRVIIVLSLMRSALGTQTTPPNQVLLGLALFLTLFIMGPTLDKVYDEAYVPYAQQKITFDQALATGSVPVKGFMLKQTRATDLELFTRLARLDEGAAAPKQASDLPIRVIIPAFVTSELKTAFQIGFMVYIPFLVIDMVVASVMMAMGMMMLSPVLVALPIKLMLFVLADGWNLLVSSLVASYAGS
ncbi:MAG TPA: flagellar type III secretion system pore protein FliP [Burkholderiaceae bacterium]|nr:flagellar type III secretion system pore protein FliP [Burkholderiaceae bacterium]